MKYKLTILALSLALSNSVSAGALPNTTPQPTNPTPPPSTTPTPVGTPQTPPTNIPAPANDPKYNMPPANDPVYGGGTVGGKGTFGKIVGNIKKIARPDALTVGVTVGVGLVDYVMNPHNNRPQPAPDPNNAPTPACGTSLTATYILPNGNPEQCGSLMESAYQSLGRTGNYLGSDGIGGNYSEVSRNGVRYGLCNLHDYKGEKTFPQQNICLDPAEQPQDNPNSDPNADPNSRPNPAPDPNADPNSRPNPAPNPQDEYEITLELPAFCDWAKIVCDFITDDVDTIPKEPTKPNDLNLDNNFKMYIDFHGSCPPDKVFEFPLLGKTLTKSFTYQPFCSVLEQASFFFVAFAYLFSGMFIVRNL